QSYFESEELKVGDFSMKLKELKVGEIVPTTVYLEKEKRMARKNAAIEQIQASDKLKTVLDMSDRLSHITDLRKLAVLRLNRLIFKFMQEYSKKESVKYELVSWLLPTELLDVVQTGDWAKIEERRSSGLMMLFKSKKTLFFQGDELRGLDLTSFTKADTSAKKLSGQVAFKGQVKARAVVVRSRNDFKRFNKGDILVTNQTTPEFVPLMRKAAAAITEQGGITCHAAIVARELELPCIIGVSNATRIIKDGAIIKVDAIKGVIELGNKE
ncbi:MAG: hypothetical protein KKG04_06370, partial [Candidatus Thermoplasmatota archaeon]|nr:hypothetical protein [Candidatus Thermoplasmatota archaeon]